MSETTFKDWGPMERETKKSFDTATCPPAPVQPLTGTHGKLILATATAGQRALCELIDANLEKLDADNQTDIITRLQHASQVFSHKTEYQRRNPRTNEVITVKPRRPLGTHKKLLWKNLASIYQQSEYLLQKQNAKYFAALARGARSAKRSLVGHSSDKPRKGAAGRAYRSAVKQGTRQVKLNVLSMPAGPGAAIRAGLLTKIKKKMSKGGLGLQLWGAGNLELPNNPIEVGPGRPGIAATAAQQTAFQAALAAGTAAAFSERGNGMEQVS